MIQQDTFDRINDWASEKYTAVAPSLMSATSQPTGVAGPLMPAAATPTTQTSTTGTISVGAPTISPPASANSSAWKAATITPTTVDKKDLATRTVDAKTETVQGQLGTLLGKDSQVLQQARADGMRTAFDRGLGNSTMAASAGTDALIRSATNIATVDAGTYSKANDYNVAAQNQATMANADAKNAAAQANAQMTQQMTVAQLNDATQRWQQEQQTATSRYNTDLNYKKDVDNQKLGVANNIIANMELSPDRKAAMLEQLGFGTMARNGQPGTGLAGAAYVIDSVGYELGGGGTGGGSGTGVLYPNATGPTGQMINRAAGSAMDQARAAERAAEQENWGRGIVNRSSDYYYYQP